MAENKVIFLGGNHHNGLGLVRTFGINGIAPYGIIIGDGAKKSFIRKSKYWEKTWGAKDEEEAIQILLAEFGCEKEKPVLIPYSDGAAGAIDRQLNELSKKFICPSINGKQGAIDALMDKEAQIEFMKKYHIPMADSVVARQATWKEDISNVVFPCIVKPVVSYEGKKSDIRKCSDMQELKEYLHIIFEIKKYHRILIQKFIDFDYEMDFFGAYFEQDISGLLCKKYRTWPALGGSSSFAQIMKNSSNQCTDKILQAFKKINFSGLFDIDLFSVNGQIYLNEINWRNSGLSFLSLGTKVYTALIWYLSVTGQCTDHLKHTCTDENQFAMNEATDLRHVVYNGYPFKKWNQDRKKVQSFALWYRKDLKPTFAQYAYLAKEMVKRAKK